MDWVCQMRLKIHLASNAYIIAGSRKISNHNIVNLLVAGYNAILVPETSTRKAYLYSHCYWYNGFCCCNTPTWIDFLLKRICYFIHNLSLYRSLYLNGWKWISCGQQRLMRREPQQIHIFHYAMIWHKTCTSWHCFVVGCRYSLTNY